MDWLFRRPFPAALIVRLALPVMAGNERFMRPVGTEGRMGPARVVLAVLVLAGAAGSRVVVSGWWR